MMYEKWKGKKRKKKKHRSGIKEALKHKCVKQDLAVYIGT